MRELVYYVAVSLDGRIASPSHGFESFLAEGDHAAALTPEWGDTIPEPIHQALGLDVRRGALSTVLMGWNTYAVGLPDMPSPYSHLEQIVFSRTRTAPVGAEGVRITDDDPWEVVTALKRQSGGDIWLCGGGVLAAQLVDLIDRLVLKVNPFVFGDGIPLFAGQYVPTRFALERSRPFETGVVVNEYRRR